MNSRYAVYFAPEDDSALARFGWSWLGRTPDSATPAPLPPTALEPAQQAAMVAEPGRYGFHATLKAPFRLAAGRDKTALTAAMAEFAANRRAFILPPLTLRPLEGFLALRPSRPDTRLTTLADDCVRAFEPWRAPLTAAETARRLAAGLTPRQRDQLQGWGYPHVFADFRFHLTLTGRLDAEGRRAARQAIAPLWAAARREPVRIASICLFVQPEDGAAFVLARRFVFAE